MVISPALLHRLHRIAGKEPFMDSIDSPIWIVFWPWSLDHCYKCLAYSETNKLKILPGNQFLGTPFLFELKRTIGPWLNAPFPNIC